MADTRALLAFTIGPVQTFIDKARTVRDLWTGSFLLSYLTAKSLDVACQAGDEVTIITPTLADDETATKALFDNLEAPSLPNRFVVQGPQAKLDRLKVACRQACLEAWWELCKAVHEALDTKILALPHATGWDDLWVDQVGSAEDEDFSRLFDLRVTLLPEDVSDQTVDAILAPATRSEGGSDEDRRWTNRLELLQQLQASEKMRRFVPDYRPAADDGQWPAKCSLLGSYEQMGPSDLQQSRKFWEALCDVEKGISVGGTRVRSNERLCAVSLVKRFAWPVKLAQQAEEDARRLRYPDTATVAAAAWLESVAKAKVDLNPTKIIEERGEWNGHWLHWKTPAEDKDEPPCLDEVYRRIQDARRACGPSPIYYAILMLDGDDMGEAFRKASGCAAHQKLSGGISRFAWEQVREKVAKYQGQLIYCGGDDVLAMLPTATAIPCSEALSEAFREVWREGDLDKYGPGTVSAGLAIVHIKEDLRFAMQAARNAEAAAKEAGKNTLALTVCRRSGEHSTAICPWEFATRLTSLVTAFLPQRQGGAGISDRWAYHLAAEMPTLEMLQDPGAVQAEIGRQIKRAEPSTREKLQQCETFATSFPEYRASMIKPLTAQAVKRGESKESVEAKIRRDFVKLCQAASFLARGRDEG